MYLDDVLFDYFCRVFILISLESEQKIRRSD